MPKSILFKQKKISSNVTIKIKLILKKFYQKFFERISIIGYLPLLFLFLNNLVKNIRIIYLFLEALLLIYNKLKLLIIMLYILNLLIIIHY
jgi:hypothetical protein